MVIDYTQNQQENCSSSNTPQSRETGWFSVASFCNIAKNYLGWKGRIGKMTYLKRMVVIWSIPTLLIVFTHDSKSNALFLSFLLVLFLVLYSSSALAVKRAHDTGDSVPSVIYLFILPGLGTLVTFLYFIFKRGTQQPNEHGLPPEHS